MAEDVLSSAIEEAVQEWTRGAYQFSLGERFGSYSGSRVQRLTIGASQVGKGVAAPLDGEAESLRSGHYIVKATANVFQSTEANNTRVAQNRSTAFASVIPSLVRNPYRSSTGNVEVLLLQVAGGSLERFAPIAYGEPTAASVLARVSYDLLRYWTDSDQTLGVTPGELLSRWMGPWCGLDIGADHASSCGRAIDRVFQGSSHIVLSGTTILPNPAEIVRAIGESGGRPLGVIEGLIHGDLHLGNVLYDRSATHGREVPLATATSGDANGHLYHLIDFAMSRRTALGFDHAFLEASVFTARAASFPMGDEIAAELYEAIEQPDSAVGEDTAYAAGVARGLRSAALTWAKNSTGWSDEISHQFALARIASGLALANAASDDRVQDAAVRYASLAARSYLGRYMPQLWKSLGLRTAKGLKAPGADQGSNKLAEAALESLGHFRDPNKLYVLIAEAQTADANLPALGRLPWAMVIDLDPASDQPGHLYEEASPVLKSMRGIVAPVLSAESSALHEAPPDRSTVWLLANGSRRSGQSVVDAVQWIRERARLLPRHLDALRNAASGRTIVPIILTGATGSDSDDRRLQNVTEQLIMYLGCESVVHIGTRKVRWNDQPVQQITLAPHQFTAAVAARWGVYGVSKGYELAIGNRVAEISPDTMRYLESELDVLHVFSGASQVLEEGRTEFWRGGTATWADLRARVDVGRPLSGAVTEMVRALSAAGGGVVNIRHAPGTGGTTIGRRVAWDLHHELPVAVLRRSDPDLLHMRLKRLAQETGSPVVLLAEADHLSPDGAEEQVRLAGVAKFSLTILRVVRVFGALPVSAKAEAGVFVVPEHLSEEESAAFLSAFRPHLVDDAARELRLHDLEEITTNAKQVEYRKPFFFGLIAFQEDYRGIDNFVEHHMAGASAHDLRVLQTVAILSLYCSEGLPPQVGRHLKGLPPSGPTTRARDVLQSGPAGLIVDRGSGWQVSHSLLARQVMRISSGQPAETDEAWKSHLYAPVRDLIHATAQSLGSTSTIFHKLLSALLINRQYTNSTDDQRPAFTPILEDMRSNGLADLAGALLNELVTVCPDPHFLNHYGRYLCFAQERFNNAEQVLRRAIELSGGRDHVHHHTLGMIFRAKVRKVLGKDGERARQFEPAALLDAVQADFNAAAGSFAKALELSPSDEYAVVANLQMCTLALQAMKVSADAKDIKTLADAGTSLGAWCIEVLDQAEYLLTRLEFEDGSVSKYHEIQSNLLLEVRGRFEEAISRWYLRVQSPRATPADRRQYCRAVLRSAKGEDGRATGLWGDLTASELACIADVMSVNVSSARHPEDYRLWLNAYRRRVGAELAPILQNLEAWVRQFPSVEPSYYLYVARFVAWFTGQAPDLHDMQEHLGRCARADGTWSNHPFVCLSCRRHVFPIVAAGDLTRNPGRRFGFGEHQSLLRRVNGVIASISQNGKEVRFKLDDDVRLEAKLALEPGDVQVFWPGKDEGSKASFFLGFTYAGLVAWGATPGEVSGGWRKEETLLREHRQDRDRAVVVSSSAAEQQARKLVGETLTKFLSELLDVSRGKSSELPVERAEAAARTSLGHDVIGRAGFRSLMDFLSASGSTRMQVVHDRDLGYVIRPGQGKRLKSGLGGAAFERLVTGSGVVESIARGDNYVAIVRPNEDVGTEKVLVSRLKVDPAVFDTLQRSDEVSFVAVWETGLDGKATLNATLIEIVRVAGGVPVFGADALATPASQQSPPAKVRATKTPSASTKRSDPTKDAVEGVGKLVFVNHVGGFGRIDGGKIGRDIFFHAKTVKGALTFDHLNRGMSVKFTAIHVEHEGKAKINALSVEAVTTPKAQSKKESGPATKAKQPAPTAPATTKKQGASKVETIATSVGGAAGISSPSPELDAAFADAIAAAPAGKERWDLAEVGNVLRMKIEARGADAALRPKGPKLAEYLERRGYSVGKDARGAYLDLTIRPKEAPRDEPTIQKIADATVGGSVPAEEPPRRPAGEVGATVDPAIAAAQVREVVEPLIREWKAQGLAELDFAEVGSLVRQAVEKQGGDVAKLPRGRALRSIFEGLGFQFRSTETAKLLVLPS